MDVVFVCDPSERECSHPTCITNVAGCTKSSSAAMKPVKAVRIVRCVLDISVFVVRSESDQLREYTIGRTKKLIRSRYVFRFSRKRFSGKMQTSIGTSKPLRRVNASTLPSSVRAALAADSQLPDPADSRIDVSHFSSDDDSSAALTDSAISDSTFSSRAVSFRLHDGRQQQ